MSCRGTHQALTPAGQSAQGGRRMTDYQHELKKACCILAVTLEQRCWKCNATQTVPADAKEIARHFYHGLKDGVFVKGNREKTLV